ncbi:transmembrane protein 256 homolog isoform X2 [Bacillus rossius redtenbacheri]|uniref:transmembrane protein 256 homolog isoform X2 n=1 Tax=Bacillus rossius redtenbacheri TaxID=93214 RepID=UPI002FDEAD36
MRMGFQESVEYILFKNPVITGTAEAIKVIGKVVPGSLLKPKAEIATTAVMPALKNVVLTGSPFIRLAGIFGASAVALGAYGAHNVYPKEGGEELKRIFETANRYHFLHSLALLGVPLCRWPKLSGSLLVLGMSVFCGTCYYHALSGNSHLRGLTPWGGTALIFGWLAMVL